MTLELSVVLPAHDPRLDVLARVLEGLRRQTLHPGRWELLVVDNRSTPPLAPALDLAWHPAARVLREETLGLTPARCTGFRAAAGEFIVLVDDDNVLAPDYLETALQIAGECPRLGAWGGSVSPRFERPDHAPPLSLYPLLTLRVVDRDLWSNDPDHHASTPWGAGLCVRRHVAAAYVRRLEEDERGLALDLKGRELVYGGDTEIAYTACDMGLEKGIFGALRLEHLIPASRCSPEYLERVSEGRGYTEVLHQYLRTGELPVEDLGLVARLRRFRAQRVGGPLERRITKARFAGRRRALEELSRRGGAPI